MTLLTALLLAATGGLVAVHRDEPALSDQGLPWWLLAGAFLAVEIAKVHLRLRQETHSLSLSEIPLVLALVFVSPMTLFATRAVGSLLAYAGYWRQRGAKLAFNLARLGVETGLAVTVHRAVLGDAAPTEPRGWVAAFAAMIAVDLLAGVLITGVLAARSGRAEWQGTLGVLVIGALAAGVTTSLALVGALLFELDVRSVLLLGVLAVTLLLAYRSHAALSRGLASLRALHDFTRAVTGSVRQQDVVATMLAEARSLLRADVAELLLPGGTGYVRTSQRKEGTTQVGLGHDAVPVWLEPVLTGQVVRISRASRGRPERLVDGAWRDVLAVPLREQDDVVGVLLVADRTDAVSTFEVEDEQLLDTLAGSASVALRNGRLVEQLLDEAAQREHRALHDPLTELPNREGLLRRLEGTAERGCAVLHVALPGLAEVRDVIGHPTGDALLVGATRLLRARQAGTGVLARLSGDDLVLLLPGVTDAGEAEREAVRLGTSLRTCVPAAGLEVPLAAAVGVAVNPPGGAADDVLRRASAACDVARAQGRPVQLHAEGPDGHGRRPLALAADLAAALRDGAIEVVYQPQVAFRGGGLQGVEALARWRHPEFGAVSPAEFVPVAEAVGLVGALTRHVLQTSVAQQAAWVREGLDLGVSVNLSMRTLHEMELCEEVADLIAAYDVAPATLTLEITESSVMGRPEATIAVLEQLAQLGVTLSIDDFGTGYSSLSYLARLPVHELKIDRSFVTGMCGSTDKTAIVRHTIALAHDLGLHVVAEGIEDVETFSALEQLGCDLAQGYLMSRPLAPRALVEWAARTIPFSAAQRAPAGRATPRAAVARPLAR